MNIGIFCEGIFWDKDKQVWTVDPYEDEPLKGWLSDESNGYKYLDEHERWSWKIEDLGIKAGMLRWKVYDSHFNAWYCDSLNDAFYHACSRIEEAP